jgi:hypothetical protein
LREKRKRTKRSLAKRNFCLKCGSALWLCDPRWPELINPHAPAIDTPLPKPPANAIRQLHCFAHARRYFVDGLNDLGINPAKLPPKPLDKARRLLKGLSFIKTLYTIER